MTLAQMQQVIALGSEVALTVLPEAREIIRRHVEAGPPRRLRVQWPETLTFSQGRLTGVSLGQT